MFRVTICQKGQTRERRESPIAYCKREAHLHLDLLQDGVDKDGVVRQLTGGFGFLPVYQIIHDVVVLLEMSHTFSGSLCTKTAIISR